LIQEKIAVDKGRNRTDRTGAKSDSPSTMFEKVLRAFVIGDLSFSDLQSSLTRLLKGGAPPDELLGVLRWRESIEPLHEEARDKIIAVLREAMPAGVAGKTDAVEPLASSESAAAIQPPAADEEPDTSAMSRLIQEFAAAWDTEPKVLPAPSGAATPESNGQNVDYKAMRLALGQREDDLAALQAEHTRVLGLLEARSRHAAQLQDELRELSGQVEASRGALQVQQRETREMEQVSAQRIAAEEAARDASIESMRGTLKERDSAIEHLNHALAARDAVIEQARGLLAERDAQIAAAQARIATLAENPPLAANAASMKESDAWTDRVLALQRSLDERDAAIEAQKQYHSKIVSAFMARAKTTEAELKAARSRIEALTSELQSRERAASTVREREREPQQELQREPDLEKTLPLLPVVESAAPVVESDPPVLELRRGLEIGEFSAPMPPKPAGARTWKFGALARAGLGAAIAVLAIVAWVASHHEPAAIKAPQAAAATSPAPGTVFSDCPTCPSLTVLPAGRFRQGSADTSGSSTVRPLHWVAITHPFAMSTSAVTVDQFRAFATATGRDMQGCDIYDGHWKHQAKNSWQNPGFEQSGTHPVTCTSWSDAKAYAQWLSDQTGHRYRLPSASEWEYAARAGSEAVQPWSANGSDACANANVADLSAARRYPGWVAFACNDGYVFTAPVGSFKASAFGLNDMLGNVFQWTEDCWNPSYKGAPIDGSARGDGNCSEHELRGGSWFSSPGYVRADYRNHFATNYRTSSVGIRLARDITP
jgi:formylglycine-generating enzyme required for sulfatase activity